MGARHVSHLFSAAVDGELDGPALRRFDDHLSGCAACEAAWSDYRAAIDAVRELPAAAMPATVRLPVGPPQARSRWRVPVPRWLPGLLHPQPIWAATGLAAVSIAAVALAVHLSGSTPSSGNSSATAGRGAAALGIVPAGPLAPAPQGAASPVVPCPVADVAASAVPPGYSNAVRSSVSGRELLLATPRQSYAPGDTVPIYARLTGAGTSVVPCVTLETGTGGAAGAPAQPAPLAAGAPRRGSAAGSIPEAAPAPSTPIAVATVEPQAHAAPGYSADKAAVAPLLSLRIPPGIPKGTVLLLVATIPPHFPGNPTDSPIVAQLRITVG